MAAPLLTDDKPGPVEHRSLIKRRRSKERVGELIDEYRKIRDQLRANTDRELDLQLRDALDSVWWRLNLVDRRKIDREYTQYLEGGQ